MANNEGDTMVTVNHKSKATTVTAINLVSEVLDEAYCIANAAKDSGQPWLYLSMIKSLRRSKNFVDTEEMSFASLKCDSYTNENNTELPANALATSTPQKDTDESNILERGDDFTRTNECTKATSQLIKNLFEMGPIDNFYDHEVKLQEAVQFLEPSEDSEIMSKIDALDIQLNEATKDSRESLNLSDFSFLSDCVDFHEGLNTHSQCNLYEVNSINPNETTSRDVQKDNVFNYEDTYLTLNRDYEHFSEDDADGLFPIMEDINVINIRYVTLALTFQEVELLTANSDENIYPRSHSTKECKSRASTLPSRDRNWPKNGIAQRCRLQSSRLIASVRRWWGRKILKKRRGPRSIIRSFGALSLDHSSIEPIITFSKSS